MTVDVDMIIYYLRGRRGTISWNFLPTVLVTLTRLIHGSRYYCGEMSLGPFHYTWISSKSRAGVHAAPYGEGREGCGFGG